MCKIIGIYGEKGTGRKTAAWLIAKTIEEIRKGTPYEKFVPQYKCWCELVCIDADEAGSTPNVILDSFGQAILDQVKLFNPYLYDVDLHDEESKNHKYIQLSTLKVVENPHPDNIYDLAYLQDLVMNEGVDIQSDWVVSVGDFILYYADMVMKKYFGKNVWLNSIIGTIGLMDTQEHRIYWDVKTQAEIEYIREQQGIIIQLVNVERQRRGGYNRIKSLAPDATLNTENLVGKAEEFWKISNQILNN